jgi:hypothetical protein
MRNLVVVNASPLLSDNDVQAKVAPLQTQIDRDFMPHWQHRVEPVQVQFASIHDIPNLPPDCWPIFLNRYSTDGSGALGWHDDNAGQNISVYSRVFVGDCMRFGLDWGVTLSHEALELILDPDIQQVWQMPDGRMAALEACDAVEDDALAYDVDGHKMSDFVLPAYFSARRYPPYDFKGHLTRPCPALTPGGYMSISDAAGNWSQIQMDEKDGLAGRRALGAGYRRLARARRAPVVVPVSPDP